MKRETIEREVLGAINRTTGYIARLNHTLHDIGLNMNELVMIHVEVEKKLSLPSDEEAPMDFVDGFEETMEERYQATIPFSHEFIPEVHITIQDYVDYLYNYIHK